MGGRPPFKPARASRVEMTEIVLPEDSNQFGHAWGGRVMALIDKALVLKPGEPAIIDSLGWVQYRLGNLEAALVQLRMAFQKQPDAEIAAHLGEVLWVSGKRDEARTLLEGLLKLSKERFVPPTHIAMIYNALNEREEALAWLERGFQQRAGNIPWMKIEPKFDPLRGDPRLTDLLRRIGIQ